MKQNNKIVFNEKNTYYLTCMDALLYIAISPIALIFYFNSKADEGSRLFISFIVWIISAFLVDFLLQRRKLIINLDKITNKEAVEYNFESSIQRYYSENVLVKIPWLGKEFHMKPSQFDRFKKKLGDKVKFKKLRDTIVSFDPSDES